MAQLVHAALACMVLSSGPSQRLSPLTSGAPSSSVGQLPRLRCAALGNLTGKFWKFGFLRRTLSHGPGSVGSASAGSSVIGLGRLPVPRTEAGPSTVARAVTLETRPTRPSSIIICCELWPHVSIPGR